MKLAKKIRLLLVGLALFGGTAAVSYADRCVPDPNAICPLIFAPVKCNDGVTYSNQCFADAACAHGCHPVPVTA